MDYDFHSLGELFQRVRPAFHTKLAEFRRFGFEGLSEVDMWNYLMESRWKRANGLMLSDIVNDILNVSIQEMKDLISHFLFIHPFLP